MQRYFGIYARDHLGVSLAELMALGRQHPKDESEPFDMAYLAMRGSGPVNGVSRRIFAQLFPRWPLSEVPIG